MKQLSSNRMLAVAAAAAVVMFATQPLHAEQFEKTKKVGGTTVHYKVVLPNGYDPAKAYPAILALGGGPQTMNTVDSVLSRNFRAEAEKRGYIVVAPAAPDGQLFFEDGARIFPEFLKLILADYKIQDGKFHIAGPSNGGIAAFHVAAANPQYFLSVTAFPGYMWQPSPAKLQAISKMCVFMYVGEIRRVQMARRDEKGSRVSSRQGHGRALYRREGPAAPAGDARRSQRRTPVRRIRGDEEGLQQVSGYGTRDLSIEEYLGHRHQKALSPGTAAVMTTVLAVAR